MLENDWPGPDQNPSARSFYRVWLGTKNPLSQTISAKGYKVRPTIGGHLFATLYFTDGTQATYDLEQTPVSVEYAPSLMPAQGNLRAAWFTAEMLRSDSLTPYKIGYPDGNSNQLCRNVFLASQKRPFLDRIKSTTQKFIRLFRLYSSKLTSDLPSSYT